MNTPTHFSPLLRVLHWLMAILLLAMLFIGVSMVGDLSPRHDTLVALHKPLGVTLLVLVLTALYVGRSQVVEAFPALAPFYERIGLRVPLSSGLELRNLTSERVTENERPVLVVKGEIRNTADEERPLPRVRVALLDESRAELEFGLFDARERLLAPGASTAFEARLLDPPEAARTYSITLAEGP